MIEQETTRLNLLPMSIADLGIFHETNTNEFVREHLWDNEEIPLALSQEILEKSEQCFANEGWGLWKIVSKNGGAYVGYVGLWQFFDDSQPQLLYAIHKHFTGLGYASEAAQKIVAYAFKQLGYQYLIASMNVENSDSIKLCQRIGFKLTERRTIGGKPMYFYVLKNET